MPGPRLRMKRAIPLSSVVGRTSSMSESPTGRKATVACCSGTSCTRSTSIPSASRQNASAASTSFTTRAMWSRRLIRVTGGLLVDDSDRDRRPVFAPDLAQPPTDLAQGDIGFGAFDEVGHQVVRAFGGFSQRPEQRLHPPGVAPGSHFGQMLLLLLADG